MEIPGQYYLFDEAETEQDPSALEDEPDLQKEPLEVIENLSRIAQKM